MQCCVFLQAVSGQSLTFSTCLINKENKKLLRMISRRYRRQFGFRIISVGWNAKFRVALNKFSLAAGGGLAVYTKL